MATSTSNPDKEPDDAFLTEAPGADISYSVILSSNFLFCNSVIDQSQVIVSQAHKPTTTKMANWTVSYNDDQGAIQILYDITNLFLKPIIKPDLLPPDLLDEDVQTLDDIFTLIVENYPDIIRQNIPMMAYITFGFLFALLR